MNSSTSIQYVTVFPKSKDRWKYYINDNFKDSHVIHTDEIKHFIITKIKAPAISDVIEMVSKYFSFVVDISNNKVYRLHPNDADNIKKLKMKKVDQFLNPKKANDQHRKEMEDKNKDFRYNNESILNRFVNIDDLT